MADAPGTCHLVGCPTKGTVDEHARQPIGCPDTFAPYDKAQHCLGFPVVNVIGDGGLIAWCSIGGQVAWQRNFNGSQITPVDMADIVDQHKAKCRNRSPR